jgi:hypothetical protein
MDVSHTGDATGGAVEGALSGGGSQELAAGGEGGPGTSDSGDQTNDGGNDGRAAAELPALAPSMAKADLLAIAIAEGADTNEGMTKAQIIAAIITKRAEPAITLIAGQNAS